ncbi:MAG: ATP-binding cassette domain-containing protein [Solirubrobacteraceae bacterium]
MTATTQADRPPAPAPGGTLLRLRGASKRFGSVQALSGVDFEVRPGEVVALVGDNGAGKSTLIKAVAGVAPADEGSIEFDGRPVRIHNPQDSVRLGIAFVYQDLALCDNLDVVDNLFLGRERTRGPVRGIPMDEITMEHRARELLDSLAVRTLRSVRAEVGMLSGGQRQTVAIARAMLGEPRLVILDEPTAALGLAQTEQVLNLVGRLRERGLGVVLVSHNLADVFAVADRIVVLRLGRNAGEFAAEPRHHQAVVSAITGAGGSGGIGAEPPA